MTSLSHSEKRLPSRSNRRRTGALLQETVVGMLIIVTTMGAAHQILHVVGKQRRAAAQRALATLEVGNLMEELASRSWSQLATETPKLDISQDGRKRLPAAELQVNVDDEPDSRARRITLSLDWQTAGGHRSDPVYLVAWRHQPLESKP